MLRTCRISQQTALVYKENAVKQLNNMFNSFACPGHDTVAWIY